MKQLMTFLFAFTWVSFTVAQVSITSDNTDPHSSAMLEVKSTTKGMLIPRMTSTQRSGINSPAEGLLVFDTTTGSFWFYDAGWNELGGNTGGASPWTTSGNDIYYDQGGVAIGKTSTNYDVEIDGSTDRSLNIINNYAGTNNMYGIRAQLNEAGTGSNRYGILSDINIDPSHSTTAYGLYTNVESSGSGNRYGVYAITDGPSSYAVYGRNNNASGYAGYFAGNTRVTQDLQVNGDANVDGPITHNDVVKINTTVSGTSNGQIELLAGTSRTIRIQAKQSSYSNPSIRLLTNGSNTDIGLYGNYLNSGSSRVVTDELEIRGGSDLAEHFSITTENIQPGMLVRIADDGDGQLTLCDEAYDPRVAGVVSGANGVSPGMLMGQPNTLAHGETPVALTGRVYVYADATKTAIRPGDLLTSSRTAGHVMRAKNAKKARAAVVGKALTGLSDGTGFVLMLIN